MSTPEMRSPGAATTGAGYDKTKQTPRIIAFPAAKATCQSCRIPFVPARAHFRLCPECHAWHRIYQGTMEACQALQEIGR